MTREEWNKEWRQLNEDCETEYVRHREALKVLVDRMEQLNAHAVLEPGLQP